MNGKSPRVGFAIALLSTGLCLCCGPLACTQDEWVHLFDWKKDKSEQPKATPRANSKSAAQQDTIGQIAAFEGLRMMQVRGYGLVVNLAGTGGTDAPKMIKDHLAAEMRRRQPIGAPGTSAQEWLESHDTAVVEVSGLIPAAAEKGTRFDVAVRALGEQTKSLVGGRLVLCDMALYAETPSGVISGQTLATAAGPIFISPFGRESSSATKANPRMGIVLGGGIVQKPRRVRLVVSDPKYSDAVRIRNRINSLYGTLQPIADAKSPGIIELSIPPEHLLRKKLFLDMVNHTTIISSEGFLEQRTKDLADEIQHSEADYDGIATTWEAIGRSVLPTVQGLYDAGAAPVRFYAGRTGLRLGDKAGLEVVAKFARDESSVFRDQAIEELGYALKMYQAGEVLRGLLNDPENHVRIKAYRALRLHQHPCIQTTVLDEDNLILDVIDCKGPFLIYAQRTLAPRIAIFGASLSCKTPAMYPNGADRDWEPRVQITGDRKTKDRLTIIYKNRINGRISPAMEAPPNVGELIKFLGGRPVQDTNGRFTGLAVPYGEILDVLAQLTASGTIPAKLEIERVQASDVLDFERPRERQESEY